jgi:thiamine biosynthesis lipoprotein
MEAGATACRVNAGGDMYAAGAPRGSPSGFAVRIRDPDGSPTDTLPHIGFFLKDAAVATSGNYERYTEIAGKRYSHILDPRTGRPVPDAVVQVTVMAKDAAIADALATALTVLGVEDGMSAICRFEDAEALFFTREDGKLLSHGTWFFMKEAR